MTINTLIEDTIVKGEYLSNKSFSYKLFETSLALNLSIVPSNFGFFLKFYLSKILITAYGLRIFIKSSKFQVSFSRVDSNSMITLG